jgi:hypothetical protein
MSTTNEHKGSKPVPRPPRPRPGPTPTPQFDHEFVRGYLANRDGKEVWVNSYVRRRHGGKDDPLTPDELAHYKHFLETQVADQKALANKDSEDAKAIGEKLEKMDTDDPERQKLLDQQKADNAESFRHRQAAGHLENEVKALPKGSEPQPDPGPVPDPVPNKPGHA